MNRKKCLISLIVVMLFLLAACSKKEDNPDTVLPDISLTEVVSSADISVADTAKYVCNNIEIQSSMIDENANLLYGTYNGNVYIVSSTYDNNDNQLIIKQASIYSSESEESYCEMPDASIYVSENVLELVDRAEDYINNNSSKADFYNYDYSDTYDVSISFSHFLFSDDSKVYGVIDYSYNFSSINLSENASSKASVLCCWNTDGSMKWNTPICILENTFGYVYNAFLLDDAYVCIYASDDLLNLYKFDASGITKDMGSINNNHFLMNAKDIIYMDNNKSIVFIVDEAGKTTASYINDELNVSGSVALPDYIAINGYQDVCKKSDNVLAFTNSQGVFEFNLADNSFVCLMDYVNSDFNGYYVDYISFIDGASFTGVYYSLDFFVEEVALFSQNNNKNSKAVVLLGCHNLPIESRIQIKKFNESDSPYRIVVNNYALFDTVDNINAGYEQLSQEIINSTGPDLLMVDPGYLNVNSLVNQNKLISWDYLVNLDDSLNCSDYLTDVISAYSINDMNYIFVYDFIYRTCIGNVDIVGSKTSWNVTEFKKALNSAPSENATLYRYITKDNYTEKLIKYNAGEYIDYENKKSSFNCKDFIDLIEYGKGLPDEIDINEEIYLYYQDSCRNGNILLMEESVVDVDGFWNDGYRYFDGKASVIGFPSSNGTASYVEYVDMPIMIMIDGNVAGAWSFTRTFYEIDYQSELSMAIPIRKDIFESWANKPLRNNSGEQSTYYYNGSQYSIPNIESSNIESIKKMISKTNTSCFYDQYIIDIIYEEVEAYYTGTQTSKQAASNIDKRINEYLN